MTSYAARPTSPRSTPTSQSPTRRPLLPPLPPPPPRPRPRPLRLCWTCCLCCSRRWLSWAGCVPWSLPTATWCAAGTCRLTLTVRRCCSGCAGGRPSATGRAWRSCSSTGTVQPTSRCSRQQETKRTADACSSSSDGGGASRRPPSSLPCSNPSGREAAAAARRQPQRAAQRPRLRRTGGSGAGRTASTQQLQRLPST